MIRRPSSPSRAHPLSGFIQAQIHSQQLQNLQLPHASYPSQTAQVHPTAAPERFPGYPHGQVQAPVITGNQVDVCVSIMYTIKDVLCVFLCGIFQIVFFLLHNSFILVKAPLDRYIFDAEIFSLFFKLE